MPYEERKDWEWFWCVDPLDGTKEFVKRNGQFTVNIGLVKGTSPFAGVVYVPAAEDGPVMYKGVKGLGPPVREIDDPLGYDSYKSCFCKAFTEADAGLTFRTRRLLSIESRRGTDAVSRRSKPLDDPLFFPSHFLSRTCSRRRPFARLAGSWRPPRTTRPRPTRSWPSTRRPSSSPRAPL